MKDDLCYEKLNRSLLENLKGLLPKTLFTRQGLPSKEFFRDVV